MIINMFKARDNKQRDIETDKIYSLEQETSTGMFICIMFHAIFRRLRPPTLLEVTPNKRFLQ